MTFSAPSLLPLLCIPIVIAFAEWFRRGQQVVLPLDHAQRGSGTALRILLYGINCLPPLLLAIALLLLAGPMRFAPPETERLVTNIQICLDVSGSMNEPFQGPGESGAQRTRFDAAMEAIDDFTQHREGDAFGLTISSNDYLHWVPLTQDLSAIRLAVPFVRPTFPTWGDTALGKGLHGCADLLAERETGDRMIILLSDGESRDIMNGQYQEVVERMNAEGITVFAVSLIDAPPFPELVKIAEGTGGKLFTALDQDALKEVFTRIDEMKRTRIIPKNPYLIDYFEPFALAGLIALGAFILSSFGLRYNPW